MAESSFSTIEPKQALWELAAQGEQHGRTLHLYLIMRGLFFFFRKMCRDIHLSVQVDNRSVVVGPFGVPMKRFSGYEIRG
jgi:hypoxanthine-guanine phosphoribosyltransferase